MKKLPIRVHSWGGLGSQFYALALIYDLHLDVPDRKFVLIHHTSGLTRRCIEIDFVELNYVTYIQIDDFAKLFSQEPKGTTLPFDIIIVKKLIKKFLTKISFLIDYDYKQDQRIFFWTTSIRGHYTNRTISQDYLNFMLVKYLNTKPLIVPQITLHYRLGDLIGLVDKRPIEPQLIIKNLNRIIDGRENLEIQIYSDSPIIAKELLANYLPNQNLSFIESDTLTVIKNCIGSEFFFGTSSKISYWIIKFRENLGLGKKTFIITDATDWT